VPSGKFERTTQPRLATRTGPLTDTAFTTTQLNGRSGAEQSSWFRYQFLVSEAEHNQLDGCASNESHRTFLGRIAKALCDSPYKSGNEPNVVTIIDRFIGQIEADPTGCEGEHWFHKN
jgi:hypothetical protein